MDAAVAEAVAVGTREQAGRDARDDLWELRRRAVNAGRDRSRRIVKTSRIDTRTGELRYNPVGRLLRDWYFHVYLNSLRHSLGEPAVIVDAQQVEDTTALLRRIRPGVDGLTALRAVGIVRNIGVDDAAHAAADIVDHLATVAARRAIRHAGDDRFDGDPVAIHLTRHWYQHCYDDHVHGATRTRQPLAEITDGQQHAVARALATGQISRIIGADGIPLVTAHHTALTPVERDLAAGLAGLIPSTTDTEHHTNPAAPLRARITRTWTELSTHERRHWLHAAGAHHKQPSQVGWADLNGDTQTKIIQLYLDTHRTDQVAVPFHGETITGEPETAAMAMFNHQQILTVDTANEGNPTEPAAMLDDDRPQAAAQLEAQVAGRSWTR